MTKKSFTDKLKSKSQSTPEIPPELNYNDRSDGYGVGEPESHHTDAEYEFDPELCKQHKELGEGYRPHLNEPYTIDDYGLRNQYGPVDQYIFREAPLRNR